MSTAALSMGVGSFKDPRTAQGLAHYLEHMLFMGTEKYPDENDYANVAFPSHSISPNILEKITPTLLRRKPIIIWRFQAKHLKEPWIDLLNFLLALSWRNHHPLGNSMLSIHNTLKICKTMHGGSFSFQSTSQKPIVPTINSQLETRILWRMKISRKC